MTRQLPLIVFLLMLSCGVPEPAEEIEEWRLDGKNDKHKEWVKRRQESLKAKFLICKIF